MCYCWTEEVCFQKAAPASLRMNVTVFREGERGLLFLAIASCHLCMGKGMWLLLVPGKPQHHLQQPCPALCFCRCTSGREFTRLTELPDLWEWAFVDIVGILQRSNGQSLEEITSSRALFYLWQCKECN